MNEQELAERFSLDVDRINQNPSEATIPDGQAPEEYKQAVNLARFIVSAVVIDQCGMPEQLWRSLLATVASRASKNAGCLGDCDELDDDQLDRVAAGTGSQATQGDHSSVSGCSHRASSLKSSICPDCGRPRGLHPRG